MSTYDTNSLHPPAELNNRDEANGTQNPVYNTVGENTNWGGMEHKIQCIIQLVKTPTVAVYTVDNGVGENTN